MAAHTIAVEAQATWPDSKRLNLVERGLPLESIAQLRELGLTFTEIAQIVIPPRTLKHRKDRGENLSTEESERVLRVRRIVALADKVFGDHDKAMGWLRVPDDRLNDRSALEVLRTEEGGRIVENQIRCVEHGMFC
jgi:putative toxin-antitoxin system antitoxin component (TIGR02293 family)